MREMKAYLLGKEQLDQAGLPCLACRQLAEFDLSVTDCVAEVDRFLAPSNTHAGFFDLTKELNKITGQAGWC